MGHRSHRNEWRTVGGPHALVFLKANQPRQSLVDPGINQGFEPDYGARAASTGSSRKKALSLLSASISACSAGYSGWCRCRTKKTCTRFRRPPAAPLLPAFAVCHPGSLRFVGQVHICSVSSAATQSGPCADR
jgi:hypothetical protein